jgi:diaminopimelate epimerase
MPQTISFTKMHGLGNDFVMLSSQTVQSLGLCPDRNKAELEKLAIFLCDRHFGIGADGLIFPAPASKPGYDIRFVYLNGDGSWAEMCGNGIRCFARFVKDSGLVQDDVFTVETLAGPIRPQINPDQTVTVDMGAPILEAAKVPVDPAAFGITSDKQVQNLPVTVLDQKIPVTAVSMGNPHCLVFQDDLPQPVDPAVFGPALEKHPAFPAKTNVEFIQAVSRNHLKVTVWERGCGFTLACGTGACATAVGAIQLGKAEHNVNIELPGGVLNIQWDGNPCSSVLMSGPATYAFTGNIELPADIFALIPA